MPPTYLLPRRRGALHRNRVSPDSSDCPKPREIEHPPGARAALLPIVVRSPCSWLRPWRSPSSHEPACPTTPRLKITRPQPPGPARRSIPGANCPALRSGSLQERKMAMATTEAAQSSVLRTQMVHPRRQAQAVRPWALVTRPWLRE